MKREEYISDETVIKRANEAARIELEKNKAFGVPVKAHLHNWSITVTFVSSVIL